MARIFITGSSTGLGLLAARRLAGDGHEVVLHARNAARADEARKALPEAGAVVMGDLETLDGAKTVAAEADPLGPFDAIIHNAAVYENGRRDTADGLPATFSVNVLAPFLLTARMRLPKRLVYLSSGMHLSASAQLDDVLWRKRPWSGSAAYSESKLYILMFAFAVARLRPEVVANGVDPGWVPTRMGGRGATDDLEEGARTQAALAAAEGPLARANQQYFHHMAPRSPHPQSHDRGLQDRLLEICEHLTGVSAP
jgi:NAD(P)-dependent dehydrogenase (short-subunit alcohol dehydrogenase family)